MAEENFSGFDDQDTNGAETSADKTVENESEDILEGIPDEDEAEIITEPLKEEKTKINKAEIAQKIKYREKFKQAQAKVRELEQRVESQSRKGNATETEEKELAAQRYIREQARREYEAIKAEEMAKQEEAKELLETQIEETLEKYPEFNENQLLDICEEFTVEPEVAAKILKKTLELKVKKPTLPTSKRGSSSLNKSENEEYTKEDKSKTMFDIAREAKKLLNRK